MDGDRIEAAASNRSRCKTCGVGIDKGELRFGAEVLEGTDIIEWHHLACARTAFAARFAVVAATLDLPDEALPPAPDEGLAGLMSIERSPSSRAQCKHCGVAIASGAMRVVVRLPPDPEADRQAGFEVKREGFIHLACAPGYTKGADGLDAYLAKRAKKADAAAVAGFARARQLLAGQPELVAAGEASVVGDWLESKHAIVLAEPDLLQLLGTLAPQPKAKRAKPSAKAPAKRAKVTAKPAKSAKR